jgi:hypothetical protein
MNSIPSSTCSTVRAAAFPFVFRNPRKRNCLPALCGVLALMLGGAWVGVRAQAGNFGTVNVGRTSATPISVTLTFNAAETLGSIAVVTQGATGLDYTNAGGGNCTVGTAYAAGDTCTVNVSFTPKFAGTRYGAAELLDGSGNVLATGYVQGTGVGPQITYQPGTQSTVSPGGLEGTEGVAVDASGNVYIAVTYYDEVLIQTPSAGGYYNSSAVGYSLDNPVGVAVDGGGNVYIGDTYNNRVLKETLSANGYSQSVVADANIGGLYFPEAVAVDSDGNVYIADVGNVRVLKETLTASGYTQSVVADAASNGLSFPAGVAVDGSGTVYIADFSNARVLKETPSDGSYTQIVIADAANKGLTGPTGVAVDGSGNVYITDFESDASGYHSRVLKEALVAGGYSQSVIATSAINNFEDPAAVAVDGSGNVYFADNDFWLVYKEDLADPPGLTFAATAVGATSTDSPKTVTVNNDGNAPLIFPLPATGDNPSVPGNFAWDASSTCVQTTASSSSAFELAAGAHCIMAFDFEPTNAGSVSGVAELTDNNLNMTGAVQRIQLTGLQSKQTITFPFPTSPVYDGVAPITLSATGGASGNPVIFSIVSGPGSLSGMNNSVLSFTGTGTIVVAANQAGDTDYSAAGTVTRSITVLPAATLTSPAPGSVLTGTSVTFSWSASTGITEYYLFLGSNGVGSDNLYSSGYTTHNSVSVTGLPVKGETVYARLYWSIDGTWHYLDYTYTAESLAMLTFPAPNSTLTGSSVTFSWSGGAGITLYYLFLGSNGVGSNNLYNSGYTTHESVNVTGLPVNGETVYARLYWQLDGTWHYVDYTYTAE